MRATYLHTLVIMIGFAIIYAGCTSTPSASPAKDAFCDIIAGVGPATVIFEDDDLMVIEKLRWHDPADCLIISKKHRVNLKDLDPSNAYDATILSKMGFAAQKLSAMLNPPGDFTVLINNGGSSAQSVFHLHMHFKSPQHWRNPSWRQKK